MYRSSAKSRKQFKPPVRTSATGEKAATSKESSGGLEKEGSKVAKVASSDEINNFKDKEAKLDEEIKKLKDKGLEPEHLQDYINLLHEYNEMKDVAQMFLGRLAIYECVTYKEMAERYNAPESE